MSTQPDNPTLEASVAAPEPPGRLTRWWNECHWQRRTILSILAAALISAAMGLAKEGMAWNQNRQLERQFKAAQAAVAAEDWPQARNLARNVLQVRPSAFEAFRIWQKALAKTRDPGSHLASVTLFTHPRAERADRLEALHALSEHGPQALALSAYAMLEDQERENPEAAAALAEVLLLRGQFTMLEELLRRQPGLEQHPPCQVALLRTLCAAPPTQERLLEAREIFVRLTRAGASTEALAAMLALAEIDGGLLPYPQLPDLAAWVDLQPEAKDWHRLLALNPLLIGSKENDDAVFSRATERFLASSPGDLGAWLTTHGQANLAATALSQAAKNDPAAFVACVHALLAANRIKEAADELANPALGVDRVELEFLHIELARLTGDESAQNRAWERALQQAPLNHSRNRFLDIARHAELRGMRVPAERAWVAAIRGGFGRLPLYRDLTPLFDSLAKQNRSADLLELFQILLRFEPQNLELKNNYHYLALIHGVDPPQQSMERFQRLAAEHPDMPSLAASAAMAALMAGHPREAIQSLRSLSTTEETSMMRHALLGTALLLNGDPNAARPLLANVDWSRFLTQESMIFRQLQKSPQRTNRGR